MPKQTWVTLTEAARRLGVHPSTLRRWADEGAIPLLLTPGGHRRFALADLEAFAQAQRVSSATELQPQWADEVIAQTRHEIAVRSPHFAAVPSGEMRVTFKELGRRLVGLAMQYIVIADDGADLLNEAAVIARQYAQISRDAGMTLTETLQASMFFHDQLLEISLQQPDGSRARPETSRLILRRINQLLNTVHLAIAAQYEAAT